ncbi:tetratricopeptide repeat protein [Hydrogenovibrio marinus]|uniref:Cds6 C-terminal domain-containing protein n=1 Tax=Hydrogenovibrio marinus TaxID=28885 RepID=A0A067A254_HYDMR|nr:tetratricopeptide repeat protein [Hydrogenovibrio marinus]KDN96666.1 hypothetical protein EI16_10470 [Hydrogenovibrio marinus]
MSESIGKGNLKNGFLVFGWMISIFCCQVALAQESDKDYTARFTQAEQMAQSATKEGADKAIELWKGMLKDYPNDLAVSNNLAATLMKEKKYAEAQNYLESALNADPKIAIIMANLNDIYAYQAQLAYQSVFKPSEINYPKGKWVALTSETVKTPEKAQLEKAKKDMQRVLNRVENWRVAWSSKDVKSYLSFYDDSYHSDKFTNHKDWAKNRENSLKRPKYIKIHLNDVKVVPLANHTFQVSFVQNYDSNRFKDSVKKYLVWQEVGKSWKIIQEKVVYD